MDHLFEKAGFLAASWALMAPVWLIAFCALAWGRTVLTAREIATGLAWTAGLSAAAFPLAWGALTHIAQFNPEPRTPAASVGAVFAVLFFPAYSLLIMAAVFKGRRDAALRRGAPGRSTIVRAIAATVLTMAVLLASMVLSAALLAGGPKLFG